jgi:hypothetical protein
MKKKEQQKMSNTSFYPYFTGVKGGGFDGLFCIFIPYFTPCVTKQKYGANIATMFAHLAEGITSQIQCREYRGKITKKS